MQVRALPSGYSPIGFQKLTVSSSAVGFTLPSTPQCRYILAAVEDNDIRMSPWKNQTPDSTTGIRLYIGDVLEIANVDAAINTRFIAVSGDGTLQIVYYGGGV